MAEKGMGLLSRIKKPTSEKNTAGRSVTYNLMDNVIGFDDDKVTPGEKLTKNINTFATSLYNDPIETTTGIIKGAYNTLDKAMQGRDAYINEDYTTFMGRPLVDDQVLAEADENYINDITSLAGTVGGSGLAVSNAPKGAVGSFARSNKPMYSSTKLPKKTRKAYKLFVRGADDKLYPLFVNAAKDVPTNKWLDADFPDTAFKVKTKSGKIGHYVPSKGAKGAVQGQIKGTGVQVKVPDEVTKQKILDSGFSVSKPSKEFPHGTTLAVAARPGWHAGTNPIATHLGPQQNVTKPQWDALKKTKQFPSESFKSRKNKNGISYSIKIRADDHVWAEVEMPDDVNWQAIADKKINGTADINDEVPLGGSYKYKQGQADAETWIIGGNMKITKILDPREAEALRKNGKDLPTLNDLRSVLGEDAGFNTGGLVKPKNYKEGGLVPMENQMNFALGGLNDEGGEIDEVSGNRVPIGGTKEGVRDDIPANVSEGEFVFPADVVRYHGLDKMMALRQEAKMGLRKMESMGQMGNSEEATMSDDMPFDMADLIVVGGQGEPMEFAEGGFVPQRETLQTAAVPTMGGGTTSGTTTTPIVYDDFMKTPVVTMQEYRNAAGETIIITSVNGKATTEIPAGYTLYTPPTNTAPSGVQAVIQTANNYSYQTSGGGEGPDTPRELQVDPDYGSMDNDTYFSTMERQNSFGGKAGNAAAMGIALAMGPLGLLTIGMLQADKKRQLTSAEQRIASETNPTKKKAYQATFTNMGGKTKEPEEENALVEFGKGFLTAVGGLFGFGNDEVETVARTAGSAAADNTNVVSTAPERSLRPQLRPTTTTTAPIDPNISEQVLEQAGIQFADSGESEGITRSRLYRDNDAYIRAEDAALDELEQKRLNEQSVAFPVGKDDMPLPTTLIKGAASAGKTSTTASDTIDDVPVPKLDDPVVFPRDTFGDVVLKKGAPITKPPADALPLLKVSGNRQPRPTPAGIGTTTIASPRLPEVTEEDISATLQRLPAGNIDKYVERLQRLNPEMEKNELLSYTPTISTLYNRMPAPAIERPVTQTDAAFGPQTEYGRRIAESMANTAGTPVVGNEVAGLGDYIPEWLKRSTTERLAPTLNQGAIQAQEILQEQALKDAEPEISPYATIPRADPPALVPAQPRPTPKGIGTTTIASPRLPEATEISPYATIPRADPPAPVPAPAITKPAVQSPYATIPRADPPEPVTAARSNASNDPSEYATAFEDPRSNASDQATTDFTGGASGGYQPNLMQGPFGPVGPESSFPGYGKVNSSVSQDTSQISDSQLSLGQARNVEPRDMYGRSPVDQTSSAFNLSPSNLASQYGNYGRGKIGQTGTPFSIDPYNSPTSTTVATNTNLTDEKRRQQSQKNITGKAKRTSKGTGTRKAAPTGDDRLSQANFLERALGIEPAKVGARRGNDGVLYRTQADKREADNRQDQAKATKRGSDRAKVRAVEGQAGVDKFDKANAADIGKRYGGDKEDGSDGPKIVCTEMYRQTQLVDWQHTMKIWHVYQEKHLTPYHQVGYHWLFKPYVRGMKNSSILTKLGAALAKHRTEHLRYILTKGKAKDNLIGNVWCKFVHPLVYIAGIIKEKIGK